MLHTKVHTNTHTYIYTKWSKLSNTVRNGSKVGLSCRQHKKRLRFRLRDWGRNSYFVEGILELYKVNYHWSWKCFGWNVSVWTLNCLFSGWVKNTLSVLYLISCHCCRSYPTWPSHFNLHSFLNYFLSSFFFFFTGNVWFTLQRYLWCVFQTNVTTRPNSDVLHNWIYGWKCSVFASRQCLRTCVRVRERVRVQCKHAMQCLPQRESIHWESVQCFP